MRKVGYCLLIMAVVISVTQVIVYAPRLPAQVASHFGINGQADDWMSKGAFLTLYLGLQFGLATIFLGLTRLLRRLPVSMINIPNREYWLADQRRQETLRYNEGMMVLLAGMTSLFMICLFQMTFQTNLDRNADQNLNVPVFATLLAIYLLAVVSSVIVMYRRFAVTS